MSVTTKTPPPKWEAAHARSVHDIIARFREAMQRAGVPPPDEIIPDGRLHRFPTNGRANDDGGWYVLHADGIPAGVFGDWRTGVERPWRDPEVRLTPELNKELSRRITEALREAEMERRRRAERAAQRAREVWDKARPAAADHP